jgi:L-lysine exporter family protein LysE/ArgO
MASFVALSQGFGITFGLIVAIGAQNALLLSQAIRNQHQWLMAAICIALDIILITCGVLGLGALIGLWPDLLELFKWGGAAFLTWYGWQALQNARNPGQLLQSEHASNSRRRIVLTTLAVTLLNPHVYLDTVILIGGVGAQVPSDARVGFLLGAWSASTVWFLSLCIAGRVLQPLFAQPKAWRILYTLVALTMWAIAALLVLG